MPEALGMLLFLTGLAVLVAILMVSFGSHFYSRVGTRYLALCARVLPFPLSTATAYEVMAGERFEEDTLGVLCFLYLAIASLALPIMSVIAATAKKPESVRWPNFFRVVLWAAAGTLIGILIRVIEQMVR